MEYQTKLMDEETRESNSKPLSADDDLVVIGWRQEIERRKHFAGTALFDGAGRLCALARQTWIGRMDDPAA